MQFGVTDHVDASGIAPADQLEQRLQLVELYDELGFDRYMLTEHHGTPLSLVPSPHLFLAAASQRTTRIRLGTLVTLLPLYNPVRLIERWGSWISSAVDGLSWGWAAASRRLRSPPTASTLSCQLARPRGRPSALSCSC